MATAIRTVVVVVMAWGMVFLTHAESGIKEISSKSWIFLILSGLAMSIFLFNKLCCLLSCGVVPCIRQRKHSGQKSSFLIGEVWVSQMIVRHGGIINFLMFLRMIRREGIGIFIENMLAAAGG